MPFAHCGTTALLRFSLKSLPTGRSPAPSCLIEEDLGEGFFVESSCLSSSCRCRCCRCCLAASRFHPRFLTTRTTQKFPFNGLACRITRAHLLLIFPPRRITACRFSKPSYLSKLCTRVFVQLAMRQICHPGHSSPCFAPMDLEREGETHERQASRSKDY